MPYTTRHVSTLLGISIETGRLWAEEFADYLSPTATPGKNRHRMFTEEDVAVLALVADMKKQGLTYADAHASLKAGQRGNLPVLPPSDVQHIISTDQETQLAFENERLQRMLVQAQDALVRAEKQLEQLETVKLEKSRLEGRVGSLEEQLLIQQENVEKLTKRIEEISRDIGREYAKGFVDGIANRNEKEVG